METENRRRHARLPRAAQITCQEITYPLGLARETEVTMLDVSEGGVRLESPAAFGPDTLLQVALHLDGWERHTTGFHPLGEDSKPLTALGRVVRCIEGASGRYELGVVFLDIWADHWRAMKVYLEREQTSG